MLVLRLAMKEHLLPSEETILKCVSLGNIRARPMCHGKTDQIHLDIGSMRRRRMVCEQMG